MQKPTKEQLKTILIEVCKHVGRLVDCKDCANYEDKQECKEYCYKNLEIVERAIFEWEKFKNQQ